MRQRNAGADQQLAGGLSVKVYGADAETLSQLGEKVVEMVNETEGFANATTGLGNGDSTINLHIDRDKVRSYGLTVARSISRSPPS